MLPEVVARFASPQAKETWQSEWLASVKHSNDIWLVGEKSFAHFYKLELSTCYFFTFSSFVTVW